MFCAPQDLVNAFRCDCLPGFYGTRCETNEDDCVSNPCIHGSCVVRDNCCYCAHINCYGCFKLASTNARSSICNSLKVSSLSTFLSCRTRLVGSSATVRMGTMVLCVTLTLMTVWGTNAPSRELVW